MTQVHNPGTAGYDYYQRRLAEGLGRKAALRALKRKISDTLYQRLVANNLATRNDPGAHTRNDSDSSAIGSHPATGTLRTSHSCRYRR